MAVGPMLSANEFAEDVVAGHLYQDKWMLMQPKIDGMRVLNDDGRARSRSWKLWRNTATQAFAAHNPDMLHGWDGEMLPGIIEGTPTEHHFRLAQSGLTATDGAKELTYYLFDNWDASWSCIPYWQRFIGLWKDLAEVKKDEDPEPHFEDILEGSQQGISRILEGEGFRVLIKLCPTFRVTSLEEVYALEARFLEEGYEGAILKRKGRGYKWGRATALEGASTKLKRFENFEAVILGTYAREHNGNEPTQNAFGHTVRSSHQENKVALECLGGFHCQELDQEGKPLEGKFFDLGVLKDLSMEDKEALWQVRDSLVGKVITCKRQLSGGGYDKPRTPVFHGFRPIEELVG